uniref:Uncharacterized protein n=1 Tax=Leptocylindrus danicus TaxID=163516 RepID=A0A7S2L329_9STRA
MAVFFFVPWQNNLFLYGSTIGLSIIIACNRTCRARFPVSYCCTVILFSLESILVVLNYQHHMGFRRSYLQYKQQTQTKHIAHIRKSSSRISSMQQDLKPTYNTAMFSAITVDTGTSQGFHWCVSLEFPWRYWSC